jgi:hypothetical protein
MTFPLPMRNNGSEGVSSLITSRPAATASSQCTAERAAGLATGGAGRPALHRVVYVAQTADRSVLPELMNRWRSTRIDGADD